MRYYVRQACVEADGGGNGAEPREMTVARFQEEQNLTES